MFPELKFALPPTLIGLTRESMDVHLNEGTSSGSYAEAKLQPRLNCVIGLKFGRRERRIYFLFSPTSINIDPTFIAVFPLETTSRPKSNGKDHLPKKGHFKKHARHYTVHYKIAQQPQFTLLTERYSIHSNNFFLKFKYQTSLLSPILSNILYLFLKGWIYDESFL